MSSWVDELLEEKLLEEGENEEEGEMYKKINGRVERWMDVDDVLGMDEWFGVLMDDIL